MKIKSDILFIVKKNTNKTNEQQSLSLSFAQHCFNKALENFLCGATTFSLLKKKKGYLIFEGKLNTIVFISYIEWKSGGAIRKVIHRNSQWSPRQMGVKVNKKDGSIGQVITVPGAQLLMLWGGNSPPCWAVNDSVFNIGLTTVAVETNLIETDVKSGAINSSTRWDRAARDKSPVRSVYQSLFSFSAETEHLKHKTHFYNIFT